MTKISKLSKREQISLTQPQKRYKTENNEIFSFQAQSKVLKKKKSSSLFKGKYNKIVNKLLDISELSY